MLTCRKKAKRLILMELGETGIVKSWQIIFLSVLIAGCSMSEELKRIERTKEVEERRQASSSNNLTGEQIFIRSCNTCHPSGRAGLGPSLENVSRRFQNDQDLRTLIRKGIGIMPPQPKTAISDTELDDLIEYVRSLGK